jgi:GNAT superfamily N-acetyltransferase
VAEGVRIRPAEEADHDAWLPLWDGYNEFYGRSGETALPPEITELTWGRLLDPSEPLYALLAENDGELVGLTHYLYHRSTTADRPICYLADIFTRPELRGRGIGRALIEAVYEQAIAAGASRVYWHTHETNSTAMLLYDDVAEHSGFVVYRRLF